MKIHREFTQQSLEWLAAKAGVLTASEAGELFTAEMKPRTGEMPKTLSYKKLAEIWTGAPLPGFSNMNMEIGSFLEGEAIPWMEWEFGDKVERVGFITSDDGRVGCSPDGLIDVGGVECKSPTAPVHCKYLMNGELPGEYAAQVHFSMFVTGAPWWKFLSYHRKFPPLVKVVFRDEKIQETIRETVSGFIADLDAKLARLTEMNGGKRPEKPKTLLTQETEDDGIGIIP